MGEHKDLESAFCTFRFLSIPDYTLDASKQCHQNYGIVRPSSRITQSERDKRVCRYRERAACQCGPDSVYHRHDGACGGLLN